MPLYDETATELIADVQKYIKMVKRNGKILIVGGIFLLWMMGIGLIPLIGGIYWLTRSPQDLYRLLSKKVERKSRQKGKPARYVNIPAEIESYVRQGSQPQPYYSQQSPTYTQQSPTYTQQPPAHVEEQQRTTASYCPRCGTIVSENMKFCTSCGSELK